MISWYNLIIYFHVISVILSIGPYFVLIPMVSKMKRIESPIPAAYIDIFQYVVRLTKHAGHVLVTTGILLIWLGHWPWWTSWVVLTVAILVSSLFFLARAFTPILKQLRQDPNQQRRDRLLVKLSRAIWLYLLLMFIMLLLMVAKPNFW